MAAGLRSHGFQAEELIAEDWGWVLPMKNDEFSLWIGCGNYEEYPDGFLCFIEPHTPVIRKLFRKVDSKSRVEALQNAIGRSSFGEEPAFGTEKWWTHDVFNSQWKQKGDVTDIEAKPRPASDNGTKSSFPF